MTEPLKITQKITGYRVKKEEATFSDCTIGVDQSADRVEITIPEPVGMHEGVERVETLSGKTYKIKPSNQKYSYYITINNQAVDGVVYPFEIFINSKNTEHFEWIATLTRLISAIFRKGGDTSFIIDELSAIHSPNGGYWGRHKFEPKGKFYKSIINEIGDIIELHLQGIAVENNTLAKLATTITSMTDTLKLYEPLTGEHKDTKQCPECGDMTLVMQGGCPTCTSCGYSKCS